MSDEKASPGPFYEHVSAADTLELRAADGMIVALWYHGSEPRTADFLLLKDAPETKREHGEMLDLLREVSNSGLFLGHFAVQIADLVNSIDERNAKR